MNSALLEAIRAQSQRIVADGLTRYEKKYSRFTTSSSKRKFENVGLDLFLSILIRIENGEPVTIVPLKQKMLEALFEVDFNTELSRLAFVEIAGALYDFIDSQPNYDPGLRRTFESYEALLSDGIGNYQFFSSSSALDIIQDPEEYQYCSAEFSFTPKQIDRSNNKIYTLFPKERYWEEFSKLTDANSYSPLYYNRIANEIGAEKQRIPLDYQDLIIYKDKLYKLNPKVKSATRNQFIEQDWIEFKSRLFDKSKSFKKVFSDNIENYYAGFLENGFDINEIISDSSVTEYSQSKVSDAEFLVSTFGGEGYGIFDSIKQLKIASDYFGGHEGSVLGGIEYITQFSEYLLAMSFGRNTSTAFEVVGGSSTFGQFDLLFSAKISENNIPGLNFLSNFGKLKSFAHSQAVTTLPDEASDKITYNPVYTQFEDGVADTYLSNVIPSSYNDQPKVDLLLYALEALFNRCLGVGDSLRAISNSLDSRGRLLAYEGLGSVEAQISELQRVFPPTLYIQDSNSKIPGGLTGCAKYILDSYSRLSKTFVYTRLPGKSLDFMLKWISLLTNKVEAVVSYLIKLGIGTSNFIPNISINSFEPSNSKVSQYLLSLGFRDSEINQLLSVDSFADLITTFAPLSDSDDLKSFFKAYELAQLIYEFGGSEGVNAYLSFLYSKSTVDSLLNILSISQKDKSKATYIQIDKYPKLIGLLIGLTYAIDPGQLIKFNKILGENNLTLLESIEYLLQSGQQNIIKAPENIELLSPIVEQLVQGNYPDAFSSLDIDYSQANSVAPIALKQWTETIGKNLGGITSPKEIHHLYDKTSGLTPKEFISIINPVSSSTDLSQMIDGFSGGAFTKLLKYANVTSLALKLGYYKNSPQLSNFESNYLENFYTLPTLLEGLGKVTESLSIIKLVFESSLNYDLDAPPSDVVDPLIFSQNKPIETIAKVIKNSVLSDEQTSDSRSMASNAPIVESPGIGNSRLPNRVPALNSITPEQFKAIFASSNPADAISTNEVSGATRNLITRFIKFSEPNKLTNLINQSDETRAIRDSRAEQKTYSPATKYEDPAELFAATRADDILKSLEANGLTDFANRLGEVLGTGVTNAGNAVKYSVPPVYNDLSDAKELTTQSLGANFLRDREPDLLYTLGDLVKPFDRVNSCKKFGGADCEALYSDTQDLCVTPLNKSLYPETYSEIPGSSPTGVYVDRPLGTFADYKPTGTLLPTSNLYAPPAYYGLLGSNVASVGRGGEPILSEVLVEPIIPDSGGYSLSEFGNTEFGLLEFIRAKFEKSTEFNCATLESPFHYQKCMNLMKCKKFSPPYEGKYYLSFCPKTLSGGRLK
jgi:hypothetical protein